MSPENKCFIRFLRRNFRKFSKFGVLCPAIFFEKFPKIFRKFPEIFSTFSKIEKTSERRARYSLALASELGSNLMLSLMASELGSNFF